ncbi:MAG: 2Fe-2S iron-sulfur cluster binding domain-containing protein [Firmicutes bacterium]|nr:2Fe-2S iron-sulfur cluster binding domain-containing protein [Bacillota bacterium]
MATGKMTIDGKPVTFDQEGGLTVLQVATRNGIWIPSLCSEEYLNVRGNCRVCMVEIVTKLADGKVSRKLTPACTTLAMDGMVVEPFSLRALELRRSIVELILANHRRNCTGCHKNKHCQLQKIADDLHIVEEDYQEAFTPLPEKRISGLHGILQVNRDRCIRCGRCKAYCSQVLGRHGVMTIGKGWDMKFQIHEAFCNDCGKCGQVCPVGCLCVDTQLEKFWDALDRFGNQVKVVFFARNLEALNQQLKEKSGYHMEKLTKLFYQLGVGEVRRQAFPDWPEGYGTLAWTAQRETSFPVWRRLEETVTGEGPVIGITTDVSMKGVVKEVSEVRAVLTPEDVELLILQSLLDAARI